MPDDTLTLDAPPEAGAAEWISITDLAERKGVTKQMISDRVLRLEAEGLLSTRCEGKGRPKFVDLAAYERVTADLRFPAKEQAAETVRHRRGGSEGAAPAPIGAPSPLAVPAASSNDPTLTQAQTSKAISEAEIRKLDLAARRNLTLPIGGDLGVIAAEKRSAAEVVRALEMIPTKAEELTALAVKEGAHAVRHLLRHLAIQVREAIATELQTLHAEGLAHENAGLYEVDLPLSEDA